MKTALFGVLLGAGALVALALLILRRGLWGPLIFLGLAVLYFGVTVVSEAVKLFHGGKVQGRDRHP